MGSACSALIGVAGGTGSGKTTVARKIVEGLPTGQGAIIEHDWYYRDRSHLTEAEREGLNFDEPAALDNDLLLRDLEAIKAGRAIDCPQYDYASHTRRREVRRVEPSPIVVVEGILLYAVPELLGVFDLRLFVDTDDDIRLLRRLKRDVEERGRDVATIDRQYRDTVRPMHLMHVAPSRRHAHLIIPEGGENGPALEVIVGRLLHLLGKS
jgi:uridine kinase